jgi:type VI secretion system secreted protein Hcp
MAGFDIFLKLDGIDGESTTKGHEKEIEVVSYDQSIDSTVPSGGGAGGGAGKATFSGVRFRKQLDTASIPIALACASGLQSQARVSRSGAPHWIFTSSRSKTSS